MMRSYAHPAGGCLLNKNEIKRECQESYCLSQHPHIAIEAAWARNLLSSPCNPDVTNTNQGHMWTGGAVACAAALLSNEA